MSGQNVEKNWNTILVLVIKFDIFVTKWLNLLFFDVLVKLWLINILLYWVELNLELNSIGISI